MQSDINEHIFNKITYFLHRLNSSSRKLFGILGSFFYMVCNSQIYILYSLDIQCFPQSRLSSIYGVVCSSVSHTHVSPHCRFESILSPKKIVQLTRLSDCPFNVTGLINSRYWLCPSDLRKENLISFPLICMTDSFK